MTVKEYLHQFTPEQWAKVINKAYDHSFISSEIPSLGTPEFALNGWRYIAPILMEDYETPEMVSLKTIRQQGGFQ